MEPQQPQTQNEELNNNNINNEKTTTNGSNNNNYMCRQSSTRWTPTTDQIRILKELYYNNGVRSPTAEQIQRISTRLRQFGKIEGKNVFYWFQNHKARERQKKRFISDHHHQNNNNNFLVSSTLQRSSASTFNNKSNDDFSNTISTHHHLHNNFSTLSPQGVVNTCSSSSAPGVFSVGQMGSFGYGGGSVNMETSFRDCSLSTGVGCVNGNINQNIGWVGVDPYASSNIYNEKRNNNYKMETLEEEQDEDEDQDDNYQPQQVHEIETLPLFPMHNEDHNMINAHLCNVKPQSDGYYSSGWCRSSDTGYGYGSGTRSRTSLELSLSYSGRSHDST